MGWKLKAENAVTFLRGDTSSLLKNYFRIVHYYLHTYKDRAHHAILKPRCKPYGYPDGSKEGYSSERKRYPS